MNIEAIEQQVGKTTVYRTPTFENSRKGTPLESDASVSAAIRILASDPNAGRVSKMHSALRTIQVGGARIFFLRKDDSVYLLSVDTEGPETAPTAEARQRIAKLFDRMLISRISELIRHLI